MIAILQRLRYPAVRTAVIAAAITLWPFAYLFPYTLNLVGIGNDYAALYYDYKAYYISMVSHGVFPMWSPTEACGYPFFSNPFAQAFYPLNALYVGYFFVIGRFASYDYQLFTVLAAGLFGAGTFLWLRSLRLPAGTATAAAMLACTSLKVTELLRFPNAIHSAAWLPWLLFGLTLAARLNRRYAGSLVFGGALLMLLTAGYPYYIIYALFLLPPYAVTMLIPWMRRQFFYKDTPAAPSSLAYVIRVAIPAAVAGALSLPVLMHMQTLMAQTEDRGTPNFNYATDNAFHWRETVGAWIFPPVSNMEGWYYFGSGVTLLIATFVLAVLTRRAGFAPRLGLLLLVLPWMALVIYFTWGRESALFSWVWHHVPVLNQMRVWGRMNIILVPAIALLFAFAWQYLVAMPPIVRGHARWLPIVSVATVALGIAAAQCRYLREGRFDGYWTHYFQRPSVDWKYAHLEFPYYFTYNFPEQWFVWCALGVSSFLLLCFIYIHFFSMRSVWLNRLLLPSLVALTALELFRVTSFQWIWPAGKPAPVELGVPAKLVSQFAQPRVFFSPLILNSDQPAYGIGLFENWGYSRHARIYGRLVKNSALKPGVSPEALNAAKRFFGADNAATRLFFTDGMDHREISSFLIDADTLSKSGQRSARLLSFDGNVLRLAIINDRPGWLTYVDNWDPDWVAEIDGHPVPITRCLGSYKAIRVPAGRSTVVYAYRPHLFPRRQPPPP